MLVLSLYSFQSAPFPLRKKARLLQWLVFFSFFRQTTELIAYVPLFTETDKTTHAKSGQRKLSAKGPRFHFLPFLRNLQNRKTPKGPPFQFFSALCEIFSKIFQGLKRVPPSSFLIFCNRMYVNESQRVPLFIFRHYATFSKFFSKKTFQKKFKFCYQSGNNDFPVISGMKGTLWVSRKCFQSFS